MLNGRVYRAGFVPLLGALALAGFSLTGRVAPLASPLSPEAFDGARAFAELQRLARSFPDRRPGSAGDAALAAEVAQTLRGLGGRDGGFVVTTHSFRAATIDGARTLTTVVAERPGATGERPIVILAHRDAAGRGAAAELSGTAALLELARVLAAGETQRTIVLVLTSGGSGGDAGAADFAAHASALLGAGTGGEGAGGEPGSGEGAGGEAGPGGDGPVDAALVLGDMAGTRAPGPVIGSLSDGPAVAPALLRSTLAAAVAQQAGLPAGATGGSGGGDFLTQLAHLVFPLPAGEQAVLGGHGLPAVLLGIGGERAPPADEPVSAARLEAMGRAALATVYALDAPPAGGARTSRLAGPEIGLPVRRKTIPGWALRLLVAALLAPALLALGDGLARLRRRGEPVGRWVGWTLAGALPFLAGALFAILLGGLGALPAPRPPVAPAALPFAGAAVEATLATVLVVALAWLAWPWALRRLGLPSRPATTDAARLAPLLVLGALTTVVWALAPLTALLALPALHLWLALASPPGPARGGAGRALAARLALLALGVAPLALLVALYVVRLDLGLGGVVHTALLLLAGGRVGVAGAALWSIAFGCLATLLLAALAPPPADRPDVRGLEESLAELEPIKIWAGGRGFRAHAGPGSLGGTGSALRR